MQFHQAITFAQARELVDYLHELGASDLYASPFTAFRLVTERGLAEPLKAKLEQDVTSGKSQGATVVCWGVKTFTDLAAQDAHDADALYSLLEGDIARAFYERDHRGIPTEWVRREFPIVQATGRRDPAA